MQQANLALSFSGELARSAGQSWASQLEAMLSLTRGVSSVAMNANHLRYEFARPTVTESLAQAVSGILKQPMLNNGRVLAGIQGQSLIPPSWDIGITKQFAALGPDLSAFRASADLATQVTRTLISSARNDAAHVAGLNELGSATATLMQSVKGLSHDHPWKLGAGRISRGLLSLSASATSVWRDWENDPITFETTRKTLQAAPHTEFYKAAQLGHVILDPKNLEPPSTIGSSDPDIEAMLRDVNPNLIPLYRGASEALFKRGTDHVRHCATSTRELLTHLLHALSPDKEVKKWPKSEEDYSNGRPTRRARLRYIYRNHSSGSLADFVDADIKTMLEVFNFFHGGTHALETKITDSELHFMWRRVNGVLAILLEVSRHDSH
jgi:hypothetical protein